MKGFLDHLAGMALGAKQAGGVSPYLPSRFVPRPSAIGAREQGLGTLEEAGPLAWAIATPHTYKTGDMHEPPRETARIEPPVAIAARREGLPFEFPSKQVLPSMEAVHPLQIRSGFEGVARPLPRRPFVNAANEAHADTGVSPSAVNAVAASLRHDWQGISRPTRDKPLKEPPPRAVTHAAPLSDAVVAGRVMAAREGSPVIHVTIDRNEVRAPAPQKPAAEQRRPRMQPTVSLSDYLRDGAPGGRE